MTRDPFVDPQDGRLAELFEQTRTAFAERVEPSVERRHLAAMVDAFQASDHSTVPSPRRDRFMKRILAIGAVKALAVGAAALVATGSALAATGSLPGPAQDAVANTIENVGLHIPGGDDELQTTEADVEDQEEADDEGKDNENEGADAGAGERRGPPARSTTDCPQDFEGNHGQFVSGTEDRPRADAAHSDCGKPAHAGGQGEGTGKDGEDRGNSAEHRQDGRRGPSENGQEHGQGGPKAESSGEGGS